MGDTGITALQGMVQFVIGLAQAIEKSISEGISILDAANFITPALLASQAFKDINNIPSELKNLTSDEAQQLYTQVAQNLTGKPQEYVQIAADIVVKIYDLYLLIKNKTPTT